MSKKKFTKKDLIEQLGTNLYRTALAFYSIVVFEGDVEQAFKEALTIGERKAILDEGNHIVTQGRALIADCKRTHKSVIANIKNQPDYGERRAITEHTDLREPILDKMEAYINAIELHLIKLKNEI